MHPDSAARHVRLAPVLGIGAWVILILAFPALPTHAFQPPRAYPPSESTSGNVATFDPGLGDWITRFAADRASIQLKYREPLSKEKNDRILGLYRVYLADLETIDFSTLSLAGKIDYVLMQHELTYQIELARLESLRDNAAREWLPGLGRLVEILEEHERTHELAPRETAEQLVDIRQQHVDAIKLWPTEPDAGQIIASVRAAEACGMIARRLEAMHQFYDAYNPSYSWWCQKPYEALRETLDETKKKLEEVSGSAESPDKIVGQPIGEEGLRLELAHEWIPYSAAELIQIAEREFQWCDEQMRKASQELGFGNDWQAAMEAVKQRHVGPGEQPALIRRLAEEASQFVQSRNLVTVPPLCDEAWRMEMMSPERQRINPFFLGGDTIIVSYPTDSMTHAEKMMSMRGNNEHFSRATVHHELIPGHHLQMFMMDRYRPYRKVFETPFWIEGWALYWEMLLWDLDFARSPEDRVGMLFWRKHRCARIIFSLGYQLGRMTPEECVDYLVDRVGHERANAEAEVRRSFMGGYPPLYQAAYMLGGLQIRALRRELVDSGRMTDREFHDAILREGPIPITMVRKILTNSAPEANEQGTWRFAD